MTLSHATHPAPNPDNINESGFLPAIDFEGERFILIGHWYADEAHAAAYAEAVENMAHSQFYQLMRSLDFEHLKDI